MPTPNNPISFGDIYSEANGGIPASATDWGRLARNDYFTGPNGSSGITFNAWGGYGASLGANRIFQIPVDPSPNFGSYRNKAYFYGNTPSFDVTLYVNNNTTDQIDDVNVSLYDDSLTYNYLNGNSGVVPLATTYGPNTFNGLQPTITPLIEVLYWIITISTNPLFPVSTMDYYINGTLVLGGATINPGPTPNVFDYTVGSTESTRNSIGYTGSYHEVIIN